MLAPLDQTGCYLDVRSVGGQTLQNGQIVIDPGTHEYISSDEAEVPAMKWKTPMENTPRRDQGVPVLYGLIASLLTALLCIFVAASIVAWTPVSELQLPYITYTINVVAVLVGALLAARRGGQRGWYYGGLTGGIYALMIHGIGLLFLGSALSAAMIVQVIVLALIGAFGGMIGVNLHA
jgi:putative membrane protein (TIGR04086 family)